MLDIIRTALVLGAITLAIVTPARAQANVSELEQEIRQRAAQIEEKLIAWRRDIHEHPELGEQETRTAALVAEHLKKLGLEVKTGVAQTGVVGLAARRQARAGRCAARRHGRAAGERAGGTCRSPRRPKANISAATST